ncbi:MAG: Cytosol aminopeptidase PepA, partial [uncultured Frankineae bacterium]
HRQRRGRAHQGRDGLRRAPADRLAHGAGRSRALRRRRRQPRGPDGDGGGGRPAL